MVEDEMHSMREQLRRNQRGVSVVEFALLAPIFISLLFGMLAYGQYFYLSHSVQQIANNAARATIAGLNDTERRSIATDAVAQEGQAQGSLIAARLAVPTVYDKNGYTTVIVRYDASNIALLRSGLLPTPGTMIERRALIRNGGMS
jgi:Flp pilus assembly protein TadG